MIPNKLMFVWKKKQQNFSRQLKTKLNNKELQGSSDNKDLKYQKFER